MDTRDAIGIAWWNRMTETERGYWCRVADSARPADAYAAYSRYADRDAAAAADPQAAWDALGGDPR